MHLSDIHFREPACLNPQTDPELPYRTRLGIDVVRICGDGPVDAILVGGDIAFKAHPDEYKVATAWLLDLADKCGCPQDRIFVVPGNHDVDRAVCKKSKAISNAQSEIARAHPHQREATLRGQLEDVDAGVALFKPLTAYNAFASPFGCYIHASRPYWTYSLDLGSGVTLRFYGLTSTLISGLDERDEAPGRLYLSPLQTGLNPEPDVLNLVMAHHPPNWFVDAMEVDSAMNDRAAIQLFGHEHLQRCTRTPEYVRFSAGALHPERYELGWKPGYNLIDLSVAGEGQDREVRIQAQVRQLQRNPEQFIPVQSSKGQDVWHANIAFPAHAKRVLRQGRVSAESVATALTPSPVSVPLPTASPAEVVMSSPSTKGLVFRFWHLTVSERRNLALRLNLITQADLELPEEERYDKALNLAAERGQLAELAGEVDKLQKLG
nr:metallophosphoesterase [uncultured Rhodoferax sp.]